MDSSGPNNPGCYRAGAQIGYIFPAGGMQGFRDFDVANRAPGWSTWLTFAISSAAPTAEAKPTSISGRNRLCPRCLSALTARARNFFVDLGIAILRAQAEAFEKLSACSLTFLGPREMDPKPKMIGVVISGAEDFLRLRREGRHAFRRCAGRCRPGPGASRGRAPEE